ncbi:MAG: hypothetical protein IJA33_00440 [Oscillospiraceae bacterium]|nr:hypothetical protein [Oscillospiraceae bacterium]
MKKIMALVLIGLLCVSASGCSMLERSYSSVQPHVSSYYESEDQSVLRAESYQDLVNDLLLLIGERAESGTIWIYAAETLGDVQQAVEAACQEVQNETPMGAYAVEYMTYTLEETAATHIDVKLTVGYRRSQQQMGAIVNITGIAALRDLLTAAAENGTAELTVQLGNFYNDPSEIHTIVSEVAANNNGGHWQVLFYPDEARAGIVEIVMGE